MENFLLFSLRLVVRVLPEKGGDQDPVSHAVCTFDPTGKDGSARTQGSTNPRTKFSFLFYRIQMKLFFGSCLSIPLPVT